MKPIGTNSPELKKLVKRAGEIKNTEAKKEEEWKIEQTTAHIKKMKKKLVKQLEEALGVTVDIKRVMVAEADVSHYDKDKKVMKRSVVFVIVNDGIIGYRSYQPKVYPYTNGLTIGRFWWEEQTELVHPIFAYAAFRNEKEFMKMFNYDGGYPEQLDGNWEDKADVHLGYIKERLDEKFKLYT